jgi:hypothetical protein
VVGLQQSCFGQSDGSGVPHPDRRCVVAVGEIAKSRKRLSALACLGQSELDASGLQAYHVQAGIKATPEDPAECFSPLWAKFNNGRPIYSYGGFE